MSGVREVRGVRELDEIELDFLVARCVGRKVRYNRRGRFYEAYDRHARDWVRFSPTALWEQGGPIIEAEGINLMRLGDTRSGTRGLFNVGWESGHWEATHPDYGFCIYGPTPLVAAMRCYVAKMLGDQVTLSDEADQEVTV